MATFRLVPHSDEWKTEMTRWLDASAKSFANSEDRVAWDVFVESGTKLGFCMSHPQVKRRWEIRQA
jgi:hypothetical protein